MELYYYILAAILVIFSGIGKSICDIIIHKFDHSIFNKYNPHFWNPKYSWKNKYKQQDKKNGAKFPGSTTIFVTFTDAWHLFQFISYSSLFVSLGIAVILPPTTLGTLLLSLGGKLLHQFIFHVFYHWIFYKK